MAELAPCVTGCGKASQLRHHVIYRQHLREYATPERSLTSLFRDERNLVAVCPRCHGRHHNRQEPIQVGALPDSVFDAAEELMGADRAFMYLRRRYEGHDSRLEELLA